MTSQPTNGFQQSDISSYAKKAVVLSVLGHALDSFDLLILGFMLPWITKDLGISTVEGTSLITATLCGSVIGGVIFGILSDRYGRVRVLSWTILLFAFFTGLCSLAQHYTDMLIYRIAAGVGLGGEFGIGMTLVSEAWPSRYRAQAASYVAVGWQMGALLAAIIVPILVPIIGWRGMFAIGVIPSIVSFVARRKVSEPTLFIIKKTSKSYLKPIALMFKDKEALKRTFALAIMCSVQNFGYYGLMTWLPNYLTKNMGYSLTRSASWTVATIAGMCFGILIFGWLADKFGRRPTFFAFQIGSAIMVVVYAHLQSPIALLIGGAVMGVFVNGMYGGFGALMSELFPTEVRSTAQNVLFNFGRAVGGTGPMIIATLSANYSFMAAMILLSGIYVIDLIVTALLVPETKGVELT